MFDNLFMFLGPVGSAAVLFGTLVSVTGLFAAGRLGRRLQGP